MENQLTHFDQDGSAHMVDISGKKITERIAVANCYLSISSKTLNLLKNGKTKKGDVLGVARLAGIMAAKKTSEIIPLCHPIPLSKIRIEFSITSNPDNIKIKSTVKTRGKTGAEMEALTAVTVSALTIYDMLKSVDKKMMILETSLIFKDGGESGRYQKK